MTPAMLAQPKGRFLLIGAAEAAAQLLTMIGAAQLPGALLPLLMQSGLAWNLVASRLLLGTAMGLKQVAGALCVLAGVVTILGGGPGGAGGAAAAARPDPFYAALVVAAMAFPSLATITKERIFTDARAALGRPLDLFCVNTWGSLAQAVFVVALLPVSAALRGQTLPQLAAYLREGAAALAGAPALPLAYVAANIAFNVAALSLLRAIGTVPLSLSMALLVPLSVLAFRRARVCAPPPPHHHHHPPHTYTPCRLLTHPPPLRPLPRRPPARVVCLSRCSRRRPSRRASSWAWPSSWRAWRRTTRTGGRPSSVHSSGGSSGGGGAQRRQHAAAGRCGGGSAPLPPRAGLVTRCVTSGYTDECVTSSTISRAIPRFC